MHPFAALLCTTFFLLGTPWAIAADATPTAAINLDIGTPPVVVVRHSLTQRYSRLVRFYEAGTIGLGEDGDIYIRDATHLSLPLRQIAEKLVDVDNNERLALVVAIADAHGGKAMEPAVRTALAQRWRSQFKSGWWLRDAQGNWQQKP